MISYVVDSKDVSNSGLPPEYVALIQKAEALKGKYIVVCQDELNYLNIVYQNDDFTVEEYPIPKEEKKEEEKK